MSTNPMQAVLFWVREPITLTITCSTNLDWHRLIFENGTLSSRKNDLRDGGPQMMNSPSRNLDPGIYGVLSEQPLSYTIVGSQAVDVIVKGGKDPWPLPPPPLKPQGFGQVDGDQWKDFYSEIFLCVSDGSTNPRKWDAVPLQSMTLTLHFTGEK